MVTANSRAATWYRQAQRAIDRRRATTALRLAVEADPAFELAFADRNLRPASQSRADELGTSPHRDRPHRGLRQWHASRRPAPRAPRWRRVRPSRRPDRRPEPTACRDGRRLRRPRRPAPRLPPSPMAELSMTARPLGPRGYGSVCLAGCSNAGCLSGHVVNGVAGSASAPRSVSEGTRGACRAAAARLHQISTAHPPRRPGTCSWPLFPVGPSSQQRGAGSVHVAA